MPTYSAPDLATKPVPSIANAACFFGTVALPVAAVSNDVLRPLVIPAGIRVLAVDVEVITAYGATAPARIGVANADGSPTTLPNAATAIAPATSTAHATVGTRRFVPAPFVTPVDMVLDVGFGAVTTGAAGASRYVVFGEFVGAN